MEVINTQQNTEAWLENRKKIIGASEVPIIMGVSPWSTPYMLWQYKINPETKEDENKDWIFEKGHRLEDIARAKFEIETGIEFPPLVVKHKELEYCQSSLDGCNIEHRQQVEIKYMGKDKFDALKDSQEVPEHYMPQVQYQLITTGFEFSYFLGINDDGKIAYAKVFPDHEMIFKILEKTRHFYYENMLKKVAPEYTDLDVIEVTDSGLVKAIEDYKHNEATIARYTASRNELRAYIETKLSHCRMRSDNVLVTALPNKKGVTGLTIRINK